MINNVKLNKLLFLIIGISALVSSFVGVFNTEIYNEVISKEIFFGVLAQDVVSLVASITLIILTLLIKEKDFKKLIVIYGILGFYIYAYGIYAIEQIYTNLYLMYLFILSFSIYSFIISLSSINKEKLNTLNLNSFYSKLTSFYAIFIAIMFNFIWISQLIPLIHSSNRIEYTFSVYIIDLVLVMPAFIILAFLVLRKKAIGYLLLPSLYILGFLILFPLALSEVIKSIFFNLPFVFNDFILFFVLSVVFLVFSILSIINLKLSFDN
ncbi:MAG: hypothetical protein ACPKM0_12735 [Pleomorphochaeta sp.]